MTRARIWLLAIVILIAGIAGSTWLLVRNHNRNSTKVSVDAGPVTITNTSDLSKILLTKQYNAVYFGLSDFIRQKVSSEVREAEIIGKVQVQNDGRLAFTVKTGPPKQAGFVVNLDRSKFDRIFMTIPKYNFAQTLMIY